MGKAKVKIDRRLHKEHGHDAITATPDTLQKVKFYGLKVLDHDEVYNKLDDLLSNNSTSRAFWAKLKKEKTVKDEFHVTLIHGSDMHIRPDIWDYYKSNSAELIGKRTKVQLIEAVFDSRLLAVTVDMSQLDIPYSNKRLHITIATADAKVRPVEANHLLAKSDKDLSISRVKLELVVQCKIAAF